ncbi:sulfurtransferase complex subunit TusB [Pseudocolwellia agarivorans]|uniref:sulfurtransferase complex subunit TusB n=1 Tax=Pseudocolwellia agarivorans TaxID=1911682 RepID=UPI000984BD40|nr:sulfurtransferase complex subunit TusB [Pseudocolwellia agarivorans]
MTILHLQRTSAFDKNDFAQCVLSIKPDDALVLIDDGCYNASHSLFINFKKQNPTVAVFHIQEHAQARAIEINHDQSSPITMAKLVELTFQYNSTITWQ